MNDAKHSLRNHKNNTRHTLWWLAMKVRLRRSVAVLALVVGGGIVTPTHGSAEPAPQGFSVDSIVGLVPAIIGAAAGPADVSSPVQRSILAQAETLLTDSLLPPPIKQILRSIITFLDGSGGGGPKLPGNGPKIAQFLYPTVGKACIGDTADSVATALAVPGPAKLPPPGPGPGQAGFVFTALGTKPLAPTQAEPLTVTWLNLDSRRSETQTLTDSAHINPAGPVTLSAIANTGPGRVVAVISGGITTQATAQPTAPGQQPPPVAAPRSCTFLPTIGMFTVPIAMPPTTRTTPTTAPAGNHTPPTTAPATMHTTEPAAEHTTRPAAEHTTTVAGG